MSLTCRTMPPLSFATAAKCYKEALNLVPPKAKGRWEATMLNLGHALRRLG